MGKSSGMPIVGTFYVSVDKTGGKYTVEIYDQNTPKDILIAQGTSWKSEEIAAGKAFLAWMEHIFRAGRPAKVKTQ